MSASPPPTDIPLTEDEDSNVCGALMGQVVLVMQGGGALGAFQAGVYHAMHEAGMEPDWVIGTSIGAINATIIAENDNAQKLERLKKFWHSISNPFATTRLMESWGFHNLWNNWQVITTGVPGFFQPKKVNVHPVGFYSTEPLKETIRSLTKPTTQWSDATRLTVGAVHVKSGQMTYFDNRKQRLCIDHVLASAALPPTFPAVEIDGEAYWDGGIYSNTPIEVVLNEMPRHSSLIFSVNLWPQAHQVPESLKDVLTRHKDIQYASRAESHIEKQQQIHHLRHVIQALTGLLPNDARRAPNIRALAQWGCSTTMHVLNVQLEAEEGDDIFKDIDFTSESIHRRWAEGYEKTNRYLSEKPWLGEVDPLEGVVVHHLPAAQKTGKPAIDYDSI